MSERLPSFNSRQLIALLRRAGFQAAYQDSSHFYLRHPQSGRTTCVPIHPDDVKRGLARKILFKNCGLTQRDVQKLL